MGVCKIIRLAHFFLVKCNNTRKYFERKVIRLCFFSKMQQGWSNICFYYHLYSEGMREGNVFTGVCPFTGGRGYPSPRFFPRSFPGGTEVLAGGVTPAQGHPPAPVSTRLGYPPPPPRDRMAERALATRRVVYLLR